jgi:hypothetical protein
MGEEGGLGADFRACGDPEYSIIDFTVLRTQQHAAMARLGARAEPFIAKVAILTKSNCRHGVVDTADWRSEDSYGPTDICA